MVWLNEAGDRPSSSDLDFRARSGSSQYFSTILDSWESTFCKRRQQWPAATTQEQYCQNKVAAGQVQRPNLGTTRTLLLHDNAAPRHRARATIQYLEGEKWQVLPHPPYSPDLAPCDFCLFSTLKTGLVGKKSVFANSRPCNSGEFTTSRHTPIGVPQRLPDMAKATETLDGQQRSTLKNPENIIAVGRFVLEL